jgi:multiple sugar transport system substrate-binding protein
MSFIYQNGGRILDEEGNPSVNTPEVIEALQFYTDLMYEYHVAPTPEDYANLGLSNGQPDPLFAQSGTAMELTGIWNFSALRDVPDLNWDIAPVWQNVERGTVSFGSGLAISADTEYPDAAFQVIAFLTSEEGQMPIVVESQDAPANRAILESDAFLESEMFVVGDLEINVETFAESAEAIFAPPLIPEWNELQSIMGSYLDEVFLDTMSVEDAVEEIQYELEMLLEE